MSPQEPMIWDPGRAITPSGMKAFKIGDVPRGRTTISTPSVVWKMEKPDFNRLWSNTLESMIKFTEEGAKAFGAQAAEVIREQVANFSKPTKGGAASKFGSFTPHENLDLSGHSLYQSIGWRHFQEMGDWKSEAGPGIGRGRKLPLNVDGESYANFVEKGTAPSEGRFIPKTVDFTMTDLSDPANTITFKGIPKTWVPKMSPDVNVLLEGWWAARRKRAMIDRRQRKMRYLAEPGGSFQLLSQRHKGARKALDRGRKVYTLTGTGAAKGVKGRVGPPKGEGYWWYRKRVSRTGGKWSEPEPFWSRLNPEQKGEPMGYGQSWINSTLESTHEFTEMLGGPLRGYGGTKNILRSVGDINYAYFSIDVKFLAMDYLSGTPPDWRLLEGMPGVVSGGVSNERGLGLRHRADYAGGGMGTHPGTPARNYMFNAAARMKTKLMDYIKQSRRGGSGGGGASVRTSKGTSKMFEDW